MLPPSANPNPDLPSHPQPAIPSSSRRTKLSRYVASLAGNWIEWLRSWTCLPRKGCDPEWRPACLRTAGLRPAAASPIEHSEVPFRTARCRPLRQPRWLPLQPQADAKHVRDRPATRRVCYGATTCELNVKARRAPKVTVT